VCTDDTGDLMQPFGKRAVRRRWAFQLNDRDRWRLADGGDVISRHHTIADAVLWVAEGKR
jgi:hypothetical protein